MQIVIIPALSTNIALVESTKFQIGGISLLERAIRNAKRAGINKIVVATDQQNIKKYAVQLGCDTYVDRSISKLNYEELANKVILKLKQDKRKNLNIIIYNINHPLIKVDTLQKIVSYVEVNDAVLIISTLSGYMELEEVFKSVLGDKINKKIVVDAIVGFKPNNVKKKIKIIEIENYELFEVSSINSARIVNLIVKEFNEEITFHIDNKSLPKVIFTDFDGCLTDDKVRLNSNNIESVKVNRKDGLAVSRLKKLKIDVIIISKEKNKIVSLRGEKLGISVMQGIDDKVTEIENFLKKNNLKWKDIWYVGNDVNDLGPLGLAELSFCPSDATLEARSVAQVVLSRRGGEGLLAEIATHLEKRASKSLIKQTSKKRR